MNPALLIDAIVRQTTVLIAALATTAGQRATLSRVADQVFADLVRELSDQGVGHKVIADMFGMALRTYHKHVARLSETTTEHGKSLWEAVLTYVEEQGPVSRAEVLGAIRRYRGAVVLVTHDEGAVAALDPDRVLLLPDGTEDLWSPEYAELISLA